MSADFNSSLEEALDDYVVKHSQRVTVGIPFKDRLDTLSNTLLSILGQKRKPQEVILVDDSDTPTDLRELPAYQAIFHLLSYHEIQWRVVFGRKIGQHHSHQIVQESASCPIIWRIDSDEIAEPNVLEILLSNLKSDVGAVGGLVPQNCPPPILPIEASNIISDLSLPNIQWFTHLDNKVKEVEHLTSSYIYRKGLAKFDLNLSPAAFREETLHTYEIKKKGYKLLVDPTAITWHFPGPTRHTNPTNWENDDKYFYEKLRNWGVSGEQSKIIVLDCGKGDHVVFKSLLPELKTKYKNITLACCFPDVFYDIKDIRLISIAEAKLLLGDIDNHNIYKHLIDLNHKGQLAKAYKSLYNL